MGITLAALIIPFILCIILFTKFRQYTVWWEYILPFAVSILTTVIIYFSISYAQNLDTEYQTYYFTEVRYYEDWNERVMRTRTVTDGKNTRTEIYFETVYHNEEYWGIDNVGNKHFLKEGSYIKIRNRWGNNTFVDMRRSYYTNDGDMHYSKYPNNSDVMFTITIPHRYTNKVANSKSVFNYEDVNPKEWDLFEYPKPGIDTPSLLTKGFNPTNKDIHNLNVINAYYGKVKQIKIWMLVWKNENLDVAYAQENYWKGGNKNELVICIGIDSNNNIQWGHVFSWSESENFKQSLADEIARDKFKPIDLNKYYEWIETHIHEWQRKEFKDFNYIVTPIPLWGNITIYMVTILFSVGTGLFVIHNEVNACSLNRKSKRYYQNIFRN